MIGEANSPSLLDLQAEASEQERKGGADETASSLPDSERVGIPEG